MTEWKSHCYIQDSPTKWTEKCSKMLDIVLLSIVEKGGLSSHKVSRLGLRLGDSLGLKVMVKNGMEIFIITT